MSVCWLKTRTRPCSSIHLVDMSSAFVLASGTLNVHCEVTDFVET